MKLHNPFELAFESGNVVLFFTMVIFVLVNLLGLLLFLTFMFGPVFTAVAVFIAALGRILYAVFKGK